MVTVALGAPDWPQWRGPNRDGKALGFTAPKTWPKELTRKWKVTVGDGVATPALAGGKLYVFTRQEGNEVMRCLDAATGQELWQDKYESAGPTGPSSRFSGPRSSPAVADGKVVALGVRGILSCWEAATGKLLWRKDEFPGAWPRFFTASSPLIVDGLCVAQLGGESGGAVVAYDLSSGKAKWKWTGESPAYASPVLMTVAGTRLIIAETERRVVALNLADGKLVWEMPYVVQGRGYNAATPIVDGATLFVAGSGRGTRALRLEKTADGLTSTDLWHNTDQSVQFNTPVLKDGVLYGLSAGNELFCLNALDGKMAWTTPIAKAAEGAAEPGGRGRGGPGRGMGMGGGGFGSIVDAGTVLLALTPSSELVVFAPEQKAYRELARIKVADSPTHAHPIPAGTQLIVKDQDSVSLWTVQ
jgi:outer membrane protein assembly factor BamB